MNTAGQLIVKSSSELCYIKQWNNAHFLTTCLIREYFQKAGDAVKTTFDLNPGVAKEMHMDEESFDLTTTLSIPPISLGNNDSKSKIIAIGFFLLIDF